MSPEIGGAMEAEFNTVADWTARVAADLGPEYHIPAACRGSGQPAVLNWLLECLGPRPGEVMIDVGAGMGGPAAYATRRTGVQPVLAEPEPGACRAAARLFGAPVVQADATALPFGAATADLAWCLGVLCTAPGSAAQRAMLGQLRRVVRPGGRIGLLVYLAAAVELDDPPEGNHFPSSGQLHDLFGQAGLEAVEVAGFRDVSPAAAGLGRPGRGRGARTAPPVRAHAGADRGRRAEQAVRQAAELGSAHRPGHRAPGR